MVVLKHLQFRLEDFKNIFRADYAASWPPPHILRIFAPVHEVLKQIDSEQTVHMPSRAKKPSIYTDSAIVPTVPSVRCSARVTRTVSPRHGGDRLRVRTAALAVAWAALPGAGRR